MRIFNAKRILLAHWIAFAAAACFAAGPDDLLATLSKPTTYVNDYAGVFTVTNKNLLESLLQEVQSKTTAEIAVVVLKSLEGGEINDFANRLFQKWGIGKKGKDNGILLIAAIEDRKVRIEVGYGLEGLIPDAKSGRLLDDHVIPFFKEGNYAGGLANGALAIATAHCAGCRGNAHQCGSGTSPGGGAASGEQQEFTPAVLLVLVLIFSGIIGLIVFAVKKGWVTAGVSGHSSSSGSDAVAVAADLGAEVQAVAAQAAGGRKFSDCGTGFRNYGGNMKNLVIVLAVIAVVFGFMAYGAYNRLVTLDENINNSWAQVETVLQRRYDLIPNLVNTVKGYAKHESGVFEEITRLRSQWREAKTQDAKIEAANRLEGALSKLMFVVENYPDLKANQGFLALQDELAGTENRISVERRRYNDTVREYNVTVRKFPVKFLADLFGFEKKDAYFQADKGDTTAPKVEF